MKKPFAYAIGLMLLAVIAAMFFIKEPRLIKNEKTLVDGDIKDIKKDIKRDIKRYAYNKTKVVVLVYHDISNDTENKRINASVISLKEFEEQMRYLHDNNFETITLEDLEHHMSDKTGFQEKSVLITFDDGYKSNYTLAYPVLKKYKFKAAIFLITGLISDKPMRYVPNKLAYLSKTELAEGKDVFEYASHTDNLHKLDYKGSSILMSLDARIIEADLKKSRSILGTDYFAYPYGEYNKPLMRIVKKCGFHMAFIDSGGYIGLQDDWLTLNRIPVFPTTTLERFKAIVNKEL